MKRKIAALTLLLIGLLGTSGCAASSVPQVQKTAAAGPCEMEAKRIAYIDDKARNAAEDQLSPDPAWNFYMDVRMTVSEYLSNNEVKYDYQDPNSLFTAFLDSDLGSCISPVTNAMMMQASIGSILNNG
jgi:hypothetical protein